MLEEKDLWIYLFIVVAFAVGLILGVSHDYHEYQGCVECELCECPKEFYFVENYSSIGNEFYADIDKFQRLILVSDNLLVKGD